MHTAIQCLVLSARQHGVDLSVDRLVHDFALEEEPNNDLLLRVASENGLKGRATKIGWDDLGKLGNAYPVLGRLSNGNTVLFVGFDRSDEGVESVMVIDPLADRAEVLTVERERLESVWDGSVVFVKRAFSLSDENQAFGFRWFIPEIVRQRLLFLEVGFIAFVLHAIALATPIYFQIVFDKVVGNQSYATLYVVGAGMLIALLFNGILGYLRGLLLLHATSRMDIRLSTRTFAKLLSLPISFFQSHSAGALNKHMQQTGAIRQFLTGRLFMTLLDASALIVFVPVLYFYSPTMTMIVLGFTAAIGINMLVIARPYQRRLEALYDAQGKRQSMLVETIAGMETVKTLALEPQQRREWDQIAADVVRMNFDVGKISNLSREISGFFEKAMIITVVFVGAQMVFTGEVSVGALIAFNMLSARVSGPLVQLVSLVQEFQQNRLSIRMLGQVMNQRSERVGARGLTPRVDGGVEFESVSFQYRDGPQALDNVSFQVPAGSIVGIVGRSGSGKSTITRLLQGLHYPGTGTVRIDGYDLRELDLPHLRMNTGVVPQNSFLFKGSLRENIAKSKPDASFEEIIAAAKLAGAYEFVERLPQGFDTIIEEGATNLSGGQRQRLAIARALLRQPRLLILDEATSALDPESEVIVQANLSKIAAGRTVIIVSHRLATLVDSHLILVVDRGKVVDQGTHADLVRRCEIYRHLWQQQAGSLRASSQSHPHSEIVSSPTTGVSG